MTITWACLVIWAAVVAPMPAALPANPEPEVRILIARQSGLHEVTHLPLSDSQLRDAKHLWVWTDGLPPRKYDVASIPRERDALIEDLRRVAPRTVTVRISGWSRPEDLDDVRVIAAPDEMWTSVPEALLPSFAVTRQAQVTIPMLERGRIRAIGKGLGTAWERVAASARSVDLMMRAASDAVLTLRQSDGTIASPAFATAMGVVRGEALPNQQAQYVADARGRIQMLSLPNADVLTLVLNADGAAPQTVSGTPPQLNRLVTLVAAGEVRGRFVDEEGASLPGIRLQAEAWIAPDVPAMSGGTAVSDERGKWAMLSLPRTRAIIRATAKGRGTFQKEVSLEGGSIDLGTIALLPSREVKLAVADVEEQPIRDALTTSDSGFEGETAADGTIAVSGLPPDQPAVITVSARGFVKQTLYLTPPFPREDKVVLDRAFTVSGRVIEPHGLPADDVVVIVTTGTKYRRLAVDAGGLFAFDVEAGADFEVTFESPSAGTQSRKEAAGRSGEARDLGVIRLDTGMIVRGRVAGSDGAPIAGARVWIIRPSVAGTIASWVAGRVAQTTSDADGAFELRGIAAGPVLVRVDAPDFARGYRNVVVEESPHDVGVIEIVRGSVVTVKAAGDQGTARLDLRGEWIDADMLAAPVVDGEARLRNVPPGEYRVTVLSGRAVTCDRTVTVAEDADASVDCPAPMIVRGRVLLDGTPVYAGSLVWSRPSGADALISTKMSPMGARQERVYGIGAGTVLVPVRPDGSFESRELRAGDWQVSWRSAEGAGTPDRAIAIPDGSEANVLVEFAGGMIRGRVLDERRQPAPGARIREIAGRLFAMAAKDGSFILTGVAAGRHRLQAALGANSSRVTDVVVESGKPTPDLILELEAKQRNALSIRVLGPNGDPKPNAIVFVEGRGVIRTLTSDAGGVAAAAFPEGLSDGARIVAFAENAWAFDQLRRTGSEDEAQSATVRFGATGSLRITSRTSSGAPEIISARAGDVAWMLARVGYIVSLTPEAPVVIQGLPPGGYDVSLNGARTTVFVDAGAVATVDLP